MGFGLGLRARSQKYRQAFREGATRIGRGLTQIWREEWLEQYRPGCPHVLQFPVNDICNSRCVMCNIWQRKRDKEITPVELRTILRDPLFSEIRFVGMNGGEPTLRADLAELGQALIDVLPRLEGMCIITNALVPKLVIARTLELASVARAAGKPFTVGISLDGVGEDHDANRGRPGNFAAAEQVINAVRAEGLPISVGCTLTPVNCYGADDLLLWLADEGLDQWEFRLGVEIRRVYNEGHSRRHPFSPEQRFHLTNFFDKLSRHQKRNWMEHLFYASLRDQIALGSPRRAGCQWRTRGVTLDARGAISYCSVKSPILGSALDSSAESIYRKKIAVRRAIVRNDCSTCQHDLVGPPLGRPMVRQGWSDIVRPWKELVERKSIVGRIETRARSSGHWLPSRILPADHDDPRSWRRVLITGWYGTETAGDKAILGEILDYIRACSPNCQIVVSTLDPLVSQQTARELPTLKGSRIVEIEKASRARIIDSVDAVILGGGPLETIAQTRELWKIFQQANRGRKARIIFGCGVGPFFNEEIRQQAGAILAMATAGFLRDEASRSLAVEIGGATHLEVACDPALAWLRRWSLRHPRGAPFDEPRITSLVRENTFEYVSDMTGAQLAEHNAGTVGALATILGGAARGLGARIDLLPMHSIWLGGDDRIFNRQVAKRLWKDPRAGIPKDRIDMERGYLTLESLLTRIAVGDIAVAMRYHGHLACLALGIPFLSIDYTGRAGKVGSLVERIGWQEWREDWWTIDSNRASRRLIELHEARSALSKHLTSHADRLIVELSQTYERVFGARGVAERNWESGRIDHTVARAA